MAEPFEDESDETTTSQPAAGVGSRPLTLLVIAPAGVTSVSLTAGASLYVGRGDDCEVHVADQKLSRKHGRIDVAERVTYTDLGSMNGSFVRHARLAPDVPVELALGEGVTIGATVLVVQNAAQGPRPRHVLSHGYFEARLEEECARAANGGEPFAVLRLLVKGDGADVKRTLQDSTAGPNAAAVLALWLREGDIVAAYAPNEYETLLLRTTAHDAERRADLLRSRLASSGIPTELGLAVYPRDGRTPERLVEHANALLHGQADVAPPAGSIVGVALQRMEHTIERVAAGEINVLILGETGVGKEVLARRLHERSRRAKAPLVSINCAALSESLLESELFGHEKGAFTGALQAKTGLLEAATGGIVLLDELGEMPPSLQAKLLRVLEQREVLRVGSLRPRPIDVRFFAATNRDLEIEIAEGRFRQDLYFRLNGIALSLPPLRERTDEIEPLARMFIAQACERVGRRSVRLAPDAMELLMRYEWPGNIRELRNVIERAVLLSSGNVIAREHLPVEKMGPLLSRLRGSRAVVAEAPAPAARAPSGMPQARVGNDLDAERTRIAQALDRCAGNQSQAAKLLGISRRTLIHRIEQFNLPRPRKRDDADEG